MATRCASADLPSGLNDLVRHSGIQPESAIIAALHIELMARCLLGVVSETSPP